MTWTKSDAEHFETELFEMARGIVGPKRIDYSGPDDPYANFRKAELFGVEAWRGAIVRLTDKLSRITSLIEQGGSGMVTSESLLDTLADALNYVAITGGLAFESLGKEAHDIFPNNEQS